MIDHKSLTAWQLDHAWQSEPKHQHADEQAETTYQSFLALMLRRVACWSLGTVTRVWPTEVD